MAALPASSSASGLFPSFATFVSAQALRPATLTIRTNTSKKSRSVQQQPEQTRSITDSTRDQPTSSFLTDATISGLHERHHSNIPAMSAVSAQSVLSSVSRNTLRRASPAHFSFPFASRSYSTALRLGPFSLRAPATISSVGFSQQRTLFGKAASGITSNRHVLAYLERSANNNPTSAVAQEAFYTCLSRANLPEILVERYNTGQFASNPACDKLYTQALEKIGAADVGSAGLTGAAGAATSRPLDERLQAIGQAVAAQTRGTNVSLSRAGTGAKSEPLYVVVDETWGAFFFRWFKFMATFTFGAYVFVVLLQLFFDSSSPMRRPGGSRDAEVKPEKQKTRFSDVHGCDEAKEELQELVEFLKDPERFSTLGGKLPKGVLLVGPPGTGKTLLARAVAGEAGVPFFYMSGSEFDEVYVGVGAKRIRDLFQAARAKSPAIVFIDELDAIGGQRQARDQAYAKQTLNQLLTELDGFDQNTRVIIVGATNFPQSLDKALTRPGRFDRNISVPLPDVRGRIAILKHHLLKIRTDTDVDAAVIARQCIGFSGAELENVVNQAAVHASKNKKKKVSTEDLNWAQDKVMMGAERKSMVIQQKDKIMTAYHEGGHALVAMLTEASMPLYKATIMPRGHALGVTHMIPEMDKVSESKKELLARIDVAMGGKVAEELIYGPDNVTTGASSDIQNATRIAYAMVTQAGMSDALGNIDLSSNYQRLSSETKNKIESEVRRLVEEGRDRATELLTKNRVGLERLANALVEYETLNRDEMERVVRGEKLVGKEKVDPNAPIKIPESMVPPPLGSPPDGDASPSPGPAPVLGMDEVSRD